MVYRRHNERYDFRKFKTVRAFGDILELILLTCIQQMMNKPIWQRILKNLQVRQRYRGVLNLKK